MRGRFSLFVALLLVSTAALAMPQALVYVGSLIVGMEGMAIIGATLIVVGTVWGASEQRKALREQEAAAKAAYNAALKDRMATIIASDAPHVYVYGECAVGARIVDVLTSGDRDQYHHLVCVHADHECEAILDVAINDKWLGTLDANDYVQAGEHGFYYTFPVDAVEHKSGPVFDLAHAPVDTAHLRVTYKVNTSDGTEERNMPFQLAGTQVTVAESHAFTCSYQWQDAIPRVRVIKLLGVPGTPADAVTMAECPTEYTATCTLDDKCATIIRLDLDHAEFQSGVPTVKVRLRGKKVHDPRDPTYPNDTPAWSNNNALCIMDYLTSPMCGVPVDSVVLEGTAHAASTTTLTLPGGANSAIDYYKDMVVRITGGNGAVHERKVVASHLNRLARESDTFAAWAMDGAGDVRVLNADYDSRGVLCMDKLVASTSSVAHRFYTNVTLDLTQTSFFSVEAKQTAASEHLIIFIYNGTNGINGASFNLTTGEVIQTYGSLFVRATSEDKGGGRWRCTVYANMTVVSAVHIYRTNSSGAYTTTGDGVNGILVSGAMAGSGHDFMGCVHKDVSPLLVGLVTEPLSNNAYTYSEQLDHANWLSKSAWMTTTPNADGVAELVSVGTWPGSGAQTIQAYQVITPVRSEIVQCIEVKKNAGDWVELCCYDTATSTLYQARVDFNLTTLATSLRSNAGGVVRGYGVEELGDGYLRIWMALSFPTLVLMVFRSIQFCDAFANPFGNTSGMSHYVRNAQVAQGVQTPPPYIATTSARILPPDATSTFHVRTDMSEIPMADYIAAANDCDGLLDFGGQMLPRYTLNGTVTAEQDRSQVLQNMAVSMAGTICATSWRINAGVWAAPVLALTQDDIVGDFSFSAGSSDADLYNGIKGQFISADNLYVATDYTPYQNNAYVTADGVEKWANIDFPFTDDVQRVHNICRILTEDQRNAFTIEASFSHKAWDRTDFGARATFTGPFIGQTAKTYRIMGKVVGLQQAVKLTLKEDTASIWDEADAVVPDSTPNTNLPNPFAIAPVESLSCSSGTGVLLLNGDGTITSRILVQWPLATTQGVVHGGYIEVEWSLLGEEVWNKAQVTGDETQVYLGPVNDGLFYKIRARTVNPVLNIKSIWAYDTHQVIGKTERPSDVPVITATPTLLNVVLTWEEISDADRKDYLIADDTGGGLVWNVYAGAQAKLPPASAGLHTWHIIARDTSKLTSLNETTCQLTINAPSAPVLSSAIQDGMVVLSWNACTGTHQVLNYEVRHGADWASGSFVGRADSRSLRITPEWTGSRTLWVAGIDVAGNVGTASSLAVVIDVPAAPALTAQIVGDQVQLDWSVPAATLPVDLYELRHGADWASGTSLGQFRVTRHSLAVAWLGLRTFWVAAVDQFGNTGTPSSVEVTISAAPAPSIITEVIDNNVLLRWGAVAGTLPTVDYELRRGSSWAAGEPIGTKSGSFTTVFETAAGVYTYWLAAIDSAGNYGTPGSVSATVNQPPDYVLKADYDSLLNGTKSNMALHGDADNSLIGPVNTTETFAEHFTTNGWTTPQAQVDAGCPVYIQPNLSPAYYEETIDYGTVLAGTRIAITPTTSDVVGAVAKSCTISVSADGSAWTDYAGVWQIYASGFRYVKFRITFTASNNTDLIELQGVNIRLDAKLKTATKMVSCNAADSGGTTVYLTDDWSSTGNKLFLDVDAITLTPHGTTPVTAITDFTDAPNPLSLKILLFDNTGARVSGTCSMTVRGF